MEERRENRGSPAGVVAGDRKAHLRRGGRVVHYTITPGSEQSPLVVCFPPIATTSRWISSPEFAMAAEAAGLRLLAVDRPGTGGTTRPHRSCCNKLTVPGGAAQCWLATHASDVAAVLSSLSVCNVRIIGVCAGTPYALHFAAAFPGLVDLSHLTPWISGDCPHNPWLVRRSAAGCFGPHSWQGVGLVALRALLVLRILRSSLGRAFELASRGLSPSEKAFLARECELDSGRVQRCVDALRHDLRGQTMTGFCGDAAACLASLRRVLSRCGGPHASLPGRITLLAAARDELVPWEATLWLRDRCVGCW